MDHSSHLPTVVRVSSANGLHMFVAVASVERHDPRAVLDNLYGRVGVRAVDVFLQNSSF